MIKLKKTIIIIISLLLIIQISILNIPFKESYKSDYIEFYDVNDNLILSQIKDKPSSYINLTELNDYTINAFIAYEDKNFYKHKGFDLLRTIKSFFINLFTFSFSQGASTISQQYARTI